MVPALVQKAVSLARVYDFGMNKGWKVITEQTGHESLPELLLHGID